MSGTVRVEDVGGGVRIATGAGSNWIVVAEGTDVTLVDTGYPGDLSRVEQSLAAAGRRVEDVVAVLITHAHIDHIGSLPELQRRSGAVVHTGAREARHLAGEYHEVATPLDVARQAHRPRTWRWLAQVLPAGVLSTVNYPDAVGVADRAVLDVPGRPVAVVTPGHTTGHTCYLLPGAGAVATGDALATGHPLLTEPGPQLLPDFFSHDVAGSRSALDTLGALDAGTVLPGHGPALHLPIADAARQARERAVRTS